MSKRYEFLDALRGIAILGVIFLHVSDFTLHPQTNIIYRSVGEGARGVQLFYIVSALTLFLSLSSSRFLGKLGETLKYFFRRFFRIAPMFYSLLILVGFFTFVKPVGFFAYVNKDFLNFIIYINGTGKTQCLQNKTDPFTGLSSLARRSDRRGNQN